MRSHTVEEAEEIRKEHSKYFPSIKLVVSGGELHYYVPKIEYDNAPAKINTIFAFYPPKGYTSSLFSGVTTYNPQYDSSSDSYILVYDRTYPLEDFIRCSETLQLPFPEEWIETIFETFETLCKTKVPYRFNPKNYTFDGKDMVLFDDKATLTKKELQEVLRVLLKYESDEVKERFDKALEYGTSCFQRYYFLKILGHGFTTSVYQVCDKDDKDNKDSCDYVMKIVDKEEAKIAKMAADLKIAPKIYEEIECKTSDIYLGEDSVAIVMDKFDGDLTKIFDVIETRSTQETINLCKVIAKRIIDILVIMKDNDIRHNDTKINNFLFKFKPDLDSKLCICIADFGIAKIKPYESISLYLSLLTQSIINKGMEFSSSSLDPEDSFYLLRELCELSKKNGLKYINYCGFSENRSQTVAFIKSERGFH